MGAVTEMSAVLGVAVVCAAVGLARATYYRRLKLPAPRSRKRTPRKLGDGERAAVLVVLHEPRFADLAPAEVYASLLDEGRPPGRRRISKERQRVWERAWFPSEQVRRQAGAREDAPIPLDRKAAGRGRLFARRGTHYPPGARPSSILAEQDMGAGSALAPVSRRAVLLRPHAHRLVSLHAAVVPFLASRRAPHPAQAHRLRAIGRSSRKLGPTGFDNSTFCRLAPGSAASTRVAEPIRGVLGSAAHGEVLSVARRQAQQATLPNETDRTTQMARTALPREFPTRPAGSFACAFRSRRTKLGKNIASRSNRPGFHIG